MFVKGKVDTYIREFIPASSLSSISFKNLISFFLIEKREKKEKKSA